MKLLLAALSGGVALLLSAILAGVDPGALFNPGVFLVVLGPVVGAIIMGFPSSMFRAVRGVLANDPALDDDSAHRVQRASRDLGQLAILTALVGVLLAGMTFFDSTLLTARDLGILISTSALCLVYGFGFKLLIATPLEALATQRRTLSPSTGDVAPVGTSPDPTPPRPWQRLLGSLLMLLSWLWGFALMDGYILGLLNLSRLLLILGLIPLLIWMTSGGRNEQSRSPFDVLVDQAGVALTAGLLGTVVGVMAVLENLREPERLGPGLAATSTGITYGLMFYIVFVAVGLDRITKTQRPAPLEETGESLWGLLLLALSIGGVFAAIFLPVAAR